MAKKVIKKNNAMNLSLSDDVLEYLLIAGTFTVLVTAPYLLVGAIPVAHHIAEKRKYNERKLRNTYHYLRRQKYIQIKNKDGKITASLTKRGKRQARESALHKCFSNLSLKKRRWDGKWRLLIYDVGVGERYRRELLRRCIKQAGFMQLQKSVWMYPYPCEEEIDVLRRHLNLSEPQCRLVTATSIGHAENFRKKFGL